MYTLISAVKCSTSARASNKTRLIGYFMKFGNQYNQLALIPAHQT